MTTHTPGTEPSIAPDLPILHRAFTWSFEPRYTAPSTGPLPLEARFSVHEQEYLQHHRSVPRIADTHRWAELVTAPLPELQPLVDALRQSHTRYRLARRDQVDSVLAFVQSAARYQPDRTAMPELRELVRCPIELLVEGAGDCEDQAILAAALLWRLGYDVALIFLRTPIGFHCLVGVAGVDDRVVGATCWHPFSERAYEYGDVTTDGLRLGELPDELRDCRGDIVPILAPCPYAEGGGGGGGGGCESGWNQSAMNPS